MSSIEPDDGGSQIDGGEEVAGGFVVARGDGAILFESTEEVFDQVTRLVNFLVVVSLLFAVFLRWNDAFFPGFAQRFENAIFGIIGLVSQNCFGFKRRQRNV